MKKTTTTVIQDERPQRWYRKRNVLIDATVIIAVVLIIAVIWWVGHRPKADTAAKVPQYSGQVLVEEVNKKYGNHDYLGAIHLIEGQKTISQTDTQLLLAGAYANAGNNQKALEIYEKQEAKKPLSESYAALAATAASQAKQYQKAIDFFQKAKQRAPQANTDQIAVYDYQIQELQKKL